MFLKLQKIDKKMQNKKCKTYVYFQEKHVQSTLVTKNVLASQKGIENSATGFLGANAPLGPASSKGLYACLYVCLYVCNT